MISFRYYFVYFIFNLVANAPAAKKGPVLPVLFSETFSVFLAEIIAFIETIYASTCIDELLLAGIERVALGTNFHANILASRTGMDYLAACARDRCVNVLGMNAFLQLMSPLFLVIIW